MSTSASRPAETKLRPLFPAQFSCKKIVSIVVALAALLIFQSLDFPDTLSPVGHSLLSVMVFMLIIWITEAVGYATSSFFLITSFALLVARCPSAADPTKLIGSQAALGMALAGFSSPAWILVTCALFLAAAIEITGLGERIGLFILSKMGAKPKRVLLGVLIMAFILTCFIPAQAANAALMTAVAMGIIRAFGLDLKDNLSKGMLLLVAFGTGIAGMGILTSGAPPIQTAMYINAATGVDISWIEWATYGLPFAIALGAALYFLVLFLFPVGNKELKGGSDVVKASMERLGPISGREKRLLAIMCITIFLWATGKTLHNMTPPTVAILAMVMVFFPGISIANWAELNKKVNWGTLMLFGGAISLGIWLLKSGAAAWVAENTIVSMGVGNWPLLAIIGVGGLFFAFFALFFSARSAATAALVPTAIGFAQSLNMPEISIWGMTLILYYTIQFSVILPVNTPMSMVAYSTETFESGEMMKVGIPLIIIAIILMVLFSATYWSWVGVI